MSMSLADLAYIFCNVPQVIVIESVISNIDIELKLGQLGHVNFG